jgi:ribosomal protein S18 acetylase RimI-like enzyme
VAEHPAIDDREGGEELPAGYVWVTARTTYLEMPRPETGAAPASPAIPEGFTIARWETPPTDEYRAMFRAVGGPWGWTGRLLLEDGELQSLLNDPAIEIWCLRQGVELAGFIELDFRQPGEVEIVYFGLRPEFIGRGLGGFVLRWTAHQVWSRPEVERFWLHTCDFDHPDALRVYQRAGFRVTDERTGPEAYPAEHVARLRRA